MNRDRDAQNALLAILARTVDLVGYRERSLLGSLVNNLPPTPILSATAHSKASDLLALPAAAFEENDADSGDRAFGDDDGPEHPARVHAGSDSEKVGQWNFQ